MYNILHEQEPTKWNASVMTDVENELSRNQLLIRSAWLSTMVFCTGLTGKGLHSIVMAVTIVTNNC